MIRCPNCQHNNPDRARYCARCGVNLGDAAPKDAQGRPRYVDGMVQPRPARRLGSFSSWRYDLLSEVRGRVLELGVRSGSNFRFYPSNTQVVATDADASEISGAQRAFPRFAQGLALSLADAQRLPFADESFDGVVATLVFCSIPEPTRALDEIARVLRPGGRLYTLDHVRCEQPVVGGLMDRLAPLWKFTTGGCNLNRQTEEIIRDSGFQVVQRRTAWWGILRWLITEPPAR
jgi:SAM-dependent methyltransferase